MATDATQRCAGCGGAFPVMDGPTHPYIGASPGCWKIYGDVLAREYGELRNPPWHRLTVDAYAAQHPGAESRRSVQSVAVHLIALHLLIEKELEPQFVTRRLAGAVKLAGEFEWLTPPDFAGTMTVADIPLTGPAAAHERAVRDWAAEVWEAWGEEHAVVRKWAGKLGDGGAAGDS